MGTVPTIIVSIAIIAVVIFAVIMFVRKRRERGQELEEIKCPFRTFDDCTRERQFHDDEKFHDDQNDL